MPRVNIEDEWFEDPRREALVEHLGAYVADGLAVRMWRLAQTHYRIGRLVPADLFDRVPNSKEFEQAGLADRRADGVYIKGQKDKFAWLAKRSEAGERGGKSPKKSNDAPGKQTKASRSKTKQVEASSSSSPSASCSPSSSASSSDSGSKYIPTDSKIESVGPAPSSLVWESYSEAYRSRYGVAPMRNATVNGQLSQLVKRLGSEAPEVIRFYVGHSDAWYAKNGHPVGLCLKDAEKLRTEWVTGRKITSHGAKQGELLDANVQAVRDYVRSTGGA